MAARVVLAAIEGTLKGTRFRFAENRLCLLGRSENCTVILPGSEVSRNHCMIDIRPPSAFLQDLGSTNGTLLNGQEIGKDSASQRNTDPHKLPSYPLAHGDEIIIAGHQFQIFLYPAIFCESCGKEIPEEFEELQTAENSETYLCPDCQFLLSRHSSEKFKNRDTDAQKTRKIQYCSQCGEILVSDMEESSVMGLLQSVCCKKCQTAFFPDQTLFLESPLEGSSNLLQIPGYRVIKKLGQGGMGTVYLGRCIRSGDLVAIKLLRSDLAISELSREQFFKEAERLRTFQHPNIIGLRDSGAIGSSFYFVMDYCSNGTLEEYMKQQTEHLSVESAVSLILPILSALDHVHHFSYQEQSFPDGNWVTVHGAVHRDIKPDNIYLDTVNGYPHVRISDFGLAKAYELSGMTGMTDTGDFAGSLGFLSRQQFLNYRYAKPEVDIWATAAVLYYLLTRRSPRDFNTGNHVYDIFQKSPTPIQDYRPDLPDALAEFLDTALDDRVEIRWKTVADFQQKLLEVLQQCHIQLNDFIGKYKL